MLTVRRTITSLTFIVVAVSRVSPTAAASSCANVVDQIETNAQAFQAEADKMGMDFTRDEFLDPALSSAKQGLKDLSSANEPDAVKAVKEGKKKLADWKKKVDTWNSQVHDVAKCLADPKCNLLEFSKQLNEDLRQWIASLGSEGTAGAAERVNKAASLLEGYTSRLGSTAVGSASAAVSCMNESSPEVAHDSVDLRKAPAKGGTAGGGGAAGGSSGGTGAAASAAAGAKGGSHLGKALLVAVGVTGAVVGVTAAASGAAGGACPSAFDVAAQSGGGVVALDDATICTTYEPCGDRTFFRACASHICSPGSCSIYYQFQGGGIVTCSTACGSEAQAGSLGNAIFNCATRAANAC